MDKDEIISQDPEAVQAWYRDYYSRKGADRNDPMRADVVFQDLAHRRCFIDAFRDVPRDAQILDVGGGAGAGLTRLLDLQFERSGLHLLDLHPGRVTRAQGQLGAQGIQMGSATQMEGIADASMDVVYAASTFVHLDPDILPEVCAQMVRVLRPGGRFMVFDWDFARPSDPFIPITKHRLNALLEPIGGLTHIRTTHGPLYPPLGRRVSRWAPALYFALAAIRPLVGFHGYVYEKGGA